MPPFFVEFRLHGYAKTHAKRLIWDVARRYHVRGMIRTRPVPHVGLYPPSNTHDIQAVISTVERVGRNHNTLVDFRITGFGCYTDSKVIYLAVEPSLAMGQLRTELTRELNAALGKANPEYDFHSAIAFKDLGQKFEAIWQYVKTREQPDIDQYLLRIAVLGRRRRLICEYDLLLKRMLTRRQALSRYWWRRTISEMQRLRGGKPREPSSAARFWSSVVDLFRL